ncbi:MAG: FtsX-like permease family protein [Eubacterium sp.]|nr:FtsX-like permease family protein [Eubacterium sp.]
MKNAMLKNALTEIVKTKSRFISIFGILAIGCGFFAGLTVSENDMKLSSDTYYDSQSLMDFRLLSTYGFDENDIEALENCTDGCSVYPSYYTDCFIGEEEGGDIVRVFSLDKLGQNNSYNTLTITEGRLPKSEDECIIDGSTIGGGFEIGDTFTLNGKGLEDTLSRTEYTVVGFYNSPMFIDHTGRGNTSIGNGEIDTTAYIPQENFITEVYTQVYITIDELSPYNTYSEEYERRRDEIEAVLEDIGDDRKILRRDEIVADAEEKLADGEKELAEQEAEVRKELDDAQKELDDGKQELDDGKKELDDSRKQLDDAKQEIADNEKLLTDTKQQLDDGKKELDDSRKLLDDTKAQLDAAKAEIDANRPLIEDSGAQIAAGEKELADSKAQLDAGKAELDASRALLDSSKQQIEDGEKQLKDSKKVLDDTKKQLDDSKKQLDDAAVTFAESKAVLDDSKRQLDEAKSQLDSLKQVLDIAQRAIDRARENADNGTQVGILLPGASQIVYYSLDEAQKLLDEYKAQYNDGLKQYNDGLKQYNDGLKKYNDGYTEYLNGIAAYNAGELMYQQGLSQYEDGAKTLKDSRKLYEDGEKQYAEGLKKYQDGLALYEEGLAEFNKGKAQYEAALALYKDGLAKYEDGRAQYEDGERLYSQGMADYLNGLIAYNEGVKRFEQGVKDYEQGETAYAEGLEKYEDGLSKYKEGLAEFEKGKLEAEEKLLDAHEELDDARRKLKDLSNPEWYIFNRADNPGFSEYGENAERIRNIAMIFPLFFAMVAVLVCLTTMTRMVEEQRTQIGTLKALGYGNGSIMFKYMLYALTAALIGAMFGIFIGMKLFPYIIMTAYGMMYEFPEYLAPYDFELMLLVVAVAVILAAVTVYFSCKNILREQPSSLMRPKAPKSGKKILLERIGFIWNHLSFSKKVSMRNLFRYKRRMLMTVVGIAGCTALLLTGFGIYDSVSDILTKQFDEISLYNGIVAFQDISTTHRREAAELLAENGCDAELVYQKQITIKCGNSNADAYLFGVKDNDVLAKYVDVRSRTNSEKYALDDNTVIINEKLATLLGNVKVGDTITLAASETESGEAVVGAICENYAYHYVYISGALYQQLFDDNLPYNSFYFNIPDGDNADDGWKDALAEELLDIEGVAAVSYKTSVGDTFRNMMKSLQLVIVVLIACAGMLAFIVLYNLTNININERIREIATLKVLGFFDKEVSFYIFRETILLTLLGTGVGLVLGRFLLDFVVRTAEIDIVMFGRDVHLLSFIWSILLTLVFAVTVMLFMHRKLKYVNMVEALKSVE